MYSSSLVVAFGSGIEVIELALSGKRSVAMRKVSLLVATEDDRLVKALARKGGVNPSDDHT